MFYFRCFLQCSLNTRTLSSDWTPVGTRNERIPFDINSTPLQILTDSDIGSGEVLRLKFTEQDSHVGPGIRVLFYDPPLYTIGRCDPEALDVPFVMPSLSQHRVWTFSKENNRLKLLCNGVKIYDFNFIEDSTEDCLDWWSGFDLVHVKFTDTDKVNNTDTASDFFRPLPTSRIFRYNLKQSIVLTI